MPDVFSEELAREVHGVLNTGLNPIKAKAREALVEIILADCQSSYGYMTTNNTLSATIKYMQDNFHERNKKEDEILELLANIIEPIPVEKGAYTLDKFESRCATFEEMMSEEYPNRLPIEPVNGEIMSAYEVLTQLHNKDDMGYYEEVVADCSTLREILKLLEEVIGQQDMGVRESSFLETWTQEIRYRGSKTMVLNNLLLSLLLRAPIKALLIIAIEIQKSKNVGYNTLMKNTLDLLFYEYHVFYRAWSKLNSTSEYEPSSEEMMLYDELGIPNEDQDQEFWRNYSA